MNLHYDQVVGQLILYVRVGSIMSLSVESTKFDNEVHGSPRMRAMANKKKEKKSGGGDDLART